MISSKSKAVLEIIEENPSLSSKEIHDKLRIDIAYATTKRIITSLVKDKLVTSQGKGRGTKYIIGPAYDLFLPIDVDAYYVKEIDEREIKEHFNYLLITDVLSQVEVFSEEENEKLNKLQKKYQEKISEISPFEYRKELERLAVDLSWKSSQIEGNTYSLLETERLLRDKETAEGKTKDEAIMLLNHKDALDFIIANPTYVHHLKISNIEDIHGLLIKELEINRNIRKRRIGISGTNYKPLDNEFQIREALEDMCELINSRANIFEKVFLVLILLSYIQAFADGNKRTARIICNAILINNKYCPISFRTIDSVEYKKAMLLFYEQNNLMAFKKIFIDQFEFAVNTYF